MTRFSLGFIIIVSIYSCGKEHLTPMVYQNIIAGDSISDGIVYTNIIDTVLENECDYIGCGTVQKYKIDLDQDDSSDYEIEMFYMTAAGYGETPSFMLGSIFISSTKITNRISMTSDTVYVNVHSIGDTIGSRMIWTNDVHIHDLIYAYVQYYTNEIPETYYYSVDNWKNQYNKYIGLQMINENDTIFGWLRIDVEDENKIIIKDFAYRK
jgi:hypothetical protein